MGKLTHTLSLFNGMFRYLKGQLQGQQERGERGKWALPAFAARLIRQTNGRYDRSDHLYFGLFLNKMD